MTRRLENRGRGALLDDPPGVHDRDPVGDLGNHGEVVRDVHHRETRSRLSRAISSSTLAWVTTSRPVVGSSSTTRGGSQTRAIAIETRCCRPPES